MKKYISNFLLTLILAWLGSLFLPWWSIMLAALISSAIVRLRKGSTFIVPFLAIAVLWIVQAWLLSSNNDFILANKISVLLGIGENVPLLLLITGVVGGIAGGIAALLGNQLGAIFSPSDS